MGLLDIAWQTAVGADLATPSVQGERPLPVPLINAYVARVFDAAQTDAMVAVAFQGVSHLLAEPPSLMQPAIMARVLRAAWRARQQRGGAPGGAPTRAAALASARATFGGPRRPALTHKTSRATWPAPPRAARTPR